MQCRRRRNPLAQCEHTEKLSGVVAEGQRARGIWKCAVLKYREVFQDHPMLYHFWHCYANDAKSAEEFLAVLLDLSALICEST